MISSLSLNYKYKLSNELSSMAYVNKITIFNHIPSVIRDKFKVKS